MFVALLSFENDTMIYTIFSLKKHVLSFVTVHFPATPRGVFNSLFILRSKRKKKRTSTTFQVQHVPLKCSGIEVYSVKIHFTRLSTVLE